LTREAGDIQQACYLEEQQRALAVTRLAQAERLARTGQAALLLGQLDAAATAAKAWLELDPQAPAAWRLAALCRLRGGTAEQLQRAAADLLRAFELDPAGRFELEGKLVAALALISGAQLDRWLDHWRCLAMAQESTPDSAALWVLAGDVYALMAAGLEQPTLAARQAEHCYDQAVASDPDLAAARWSRARWLLREHARARGFVATPNGASNAGQVVGVTNHADWAATLAAELTAELAWLAAWRTGRWEVDLLTAAWMAQCGERTEALRWLARAGELGAPRQAMVQIIPDPQLLSVITACEKVQDW
jgi:tetratricopeptide (TPR) repeat protein